MRALDPSARIGTKVAGRYRVISELSRGGMGVVYVAMQEPLERQIALKIMLPGPAADRTLRRRFIQEAQALSRIVHPNIVTIFDFGEVEDGSLFIAMELVSGRNLRELLQDRGRVAWPESVQMVIGATRALIAAHAANITHRDLKPDNIMLSGGRWRADDVKLLDFGLARTLGEGEQLTQHNVIPGTPHYIAPERITSRVDDPRSDLYALGAIWFELLSGRLPYQGDTVAAILIAHMQEPVPRLSRLEPSLNLPPEIDKVVARLLAKQPEERWGSAQDFLADLEALDKTLSGRPVSTAARSAPAVPRPSSRWTNSSASRIDVGPAIVPPPAVGPGAPAPSALRSAPPPSRPVPPAVTPAPPPSRPAPPGSVTPAPATTPKPAARGGPRDAGELRVGSELIRVEQEYNAAARRLVCVAIFRGRLLRKVELSVPDLPPQQLQAWIASAREDFVVGLRALAAKLPVDAGQPAPESAESRLFFFALDAWLGGDRETALRTIESLRLALPNDVRLANTHKKLLLETSLPPSVK